MWCFLSVYTMRHKNDHDAPRVVYHKVSLSVDI